MADRIRCSCRRCTIRSLMGPAVIITVGLLFLLQQMRGDFFGFGRTWPVILIVIGAISLASSLAPADGHIESIPVVTTPPPPQPPQPPTVTPGPYAGQ